jgi:hypothetical protein
MRKSIDRMFALACAALALLTPAPLPAGPSSPSDELARGFVDPPPSARPHTWWHWINGNISREGITADLEAMERAGIGGAQIFNVDVGIPAGAVPFMSDRWRDMIRHAAREADRLGLELCVHNCAGWSSSGGPWVKPEHAMQVLAWSEKSVRGPARFAEVLPPARPPQVVRAVPYYRDIAVLAFRRPPAGDPLPIANLGAKSAVVRGDRLPPAIAPTPPGRAIPRDEVVNLTDRLETDGRLTWDIPEGEWSILRIGYTPTGKDNHPAPPEGRGLECDKLSREALDAHWGGMMATILRDLGPLAGRSLNNALIDSYEVGSQNWTPKFREEFRRRRGYDLLPFLPVITGRVVDSVEASERFLWDFRRTICDLYADNYFGYFGSLCRRHGLKFSVEPYGNGCFDDLQCGGLADIPMGEFWVGGAAIETTKLAASAGHTRGHTVIGAESFTADRQRGRFLVDPYSIKALGDMVFCNGVNRYIFHRYAHQPWIDLKPGMTMGPWGMHLERTETWWDQGAAWLRYVARCQYMLQAGRFVADACYFYGEEGPNTLPGRRGLRPELPQGYDYDGCDATVVLQQMRVRGGRIVLPDGVSYRLLVLPDSPFMTQAMVRKIRDLVRAGATVVGPKPSKSPSLSGYPRSDEEVRQVAEEVWGGGDGNSAQKHEYGRGRVIRGGGLQEVLSEMGLKPDFEYASPARDARLAYIHRAAGDTDIYFVSNQHYRSEDVDCTFRVSGKAPELWSPDTGAMEVAPVYREKDGRVTVPIRFDPAGSVFVVFRGRAGREDHLASVTRSGPALPKPPPAKIEIRQARYEPVRGQGGVDVTARVAAMVADGQYSIPATNEAFGDPTPQVFKRLRVQYLLDGKPMQKTAAENEILDLVEGQEQVLPPPFEVSTNPSGRVELLPWQPGEYEWRTSRGGLKKIAVPQAADTFTLEGPWDLRFPPGWGAPASARFDRLVSWSDHGDPGVKYFSGTAEYVKEFDVPAGMLGSGRALDLDLGRVKNFAEVKLNGRNLGVLWKAPFGLDVSGSVKPGRNVLSVRVTNLWPNRLIGDEQGPEGAPDAVEWRGEAIAKWPPWLLERSPRPPSGRFTFTTWRFYRKDSPLLESGLLGPVILRSVKKVVLSLS